MASSRSALSMGPVLTVLLLAAEPAASRLADVLREQLTATVHPCGDTRSAIALLQTHGVDLLLLEETLVSDHAATLQELEEASEGATMLELNFATANPRRAVRLVQVARRRNLRERERAQQEARLHLRNEVNAYISGILLQSQLALYQAGPELKPSLELLVEQAEALCRKLQD